MGLFLFFSSFTETSVDAVCAFLFKAVHVNIILLFLARIQGFPVLFSDACLVFYIDREAARKEGCHGSSKDPFI